jgi:hypothetical protein
MPFVVHFRGLDLHHITPHVSFPIDLSVPQSVRLSIRLDGR